MTEARDLASGKGRKDENFPVASLLLRPEHRRPIVAFYRFARAADDIADNREATAVTKQELLASMRAGLDGDGAVEAMELREIMSRAGIDPIHAHELLDAFVRDVTVKRYQDFDDLIAYCRLSAMPVGRYVLDVHGESRDIWPLSDALCSALQIVNHLQDCGKDYRLLDRVYIPLDTGLRVEDLGGSHATPELRIILDGLIRRTRDLLNRSAGFSALISDRRLAAEVAVIQRLAISLCDRLEMHDPLSERVHHGKMKAAFLSICAAVPTLLRRAA
jgi:hydroxysqualene synthase